MRKAYCTLVAKSEAKRPVGKRGIYRMILKLIFEGAWTGLKGHKLRLLWSRWYTSWFQCN